MYDARTAPGASSAMTRCVPQSPCGYGDVSDLHGLVLQAALAGDNMLYPAPNSLWAKEGMHRAAALLRLLDRRAQRSQRSAVDECMDAGENHLARSLAWAYRSLATNDEAAIVPCAALLRDIILNLGALLGRDEGIAVQADIQRFNLSADRRRALLLCASELVINALTHAFHDAGPDRRVHVSLKMLRGGHACLRVADNGRAARPSRAARSMADLLAEAAGGRLIYHAHADHGMVAEVTVSAVSLRRTTLIQIAGLTQTRRYRPKTCRAIIKCTSSSSGYAGVTATGGASPGYAP